MSYYTSGHYTSTKPIIHDVRYDPRYSSRTSSTDSQRSSFSRSSAEYSSRSSTGYGGSSEELKYKYRVPDNGNNTDPRSQSSRQSTNGASTDRQYITSTTTRGGNVETINHRQGRYDKEEPRASDATHEENSRSHKSSSGPHKKLR